MCRWLVYCGKPDFPSNYIFDGEHSLIHQSMHAQEGKTEVNADGCGIGWYTEREYPALFKDVLPAWNDQNLRHLCYHIKSSLFFAHIRAATGTSTSRDNCHPFSYKTSLFMHNGQIGDYKKIRKKIEMQVDEEFYPYRFGTTDSELMFYLILQNLKTYQVIDAIQKMIDDIESLLQQAKIKKSFQISAALTYHDQIIIIRHSTKMRDPSIYYDDNKNGLLIVSEPINKKQTWKKIPKNSVAFIDIQKNKLQDIQTLH